MHQPILISDFDGTMTRYDFYRLAIERLLPADTPDYWTEYRSGAITHFEALRRYFAAIRKDANEVLKIVRQMELDPELPAAIETLKDAGWKVIVTSAGCGWYIEQLLSDAGVDIQVYANPGRFEPGAGLQMEMPTDSPYLSKNLGVDKAEVVRHYTSMGGTVAFAGDGFPDADAARMVSGHLRFARSDLAQVLYHEGLDFQQFATWSDIPRRLLAVGD